MGAVVHFDLTARTYRSAYQFARARAVAGDRAGADALLARLLWHVEAKDGGFIGLTDCQLRAKVALDPCLNMNDVALFQYAPGQWPAPHTARLVEVAA